MAGKKCIYIYLSNLNMDCNGIKKLLMRLPLMVIFAKTGLS